MTLEIDRVSVGVMWDRLISIANETVETLVRTSFSTLVRENYDLACMIFDEKGRLVSQGSEGQPAFVGTGTATLRHMLSAIPPERLSDGDVLITNDAWHGTGHLWDVSVMRPVFVKGRLVAFILSISHLPDIGGRGLSAQNQSIYEEGLQLPVVRICEEGRTNQFILDLIASNVRVPEQVICDVLANVSCTATGARLLIEMMQEYQLEGIHELSSIIIKQSDEAMRQSIRSIPNGIYKNRVEVDVLENVTLACTITVSNQSLVVDFDGTSRQIIAGVNVPLCYGRAISAYSLKSILLPEVPNNQGAFDAIEIKAPSGCILNAQRPAATGARMLVGHYVMPLIFGALADVLPQAVQAEAGMMNAVNFTGYGADGQQFSTIFFTSGALGAMHGLDGLSATPAPASLKTMSAEMWEMLTGISIRARSLRRGSGGRGRWRGGDGQSITFRNDTQNQLSVSLLGSRCKVGAKGYAGGLPGAVRQFLINDEVVDPLGKFQVEMGGTLTVNDAGGGGYGRSTS